ncbi:PREDICTED: MAM and LDL-receptor class A domain-containing protein 1-like [Branchiostoma belcheri]|uniref:MAM and LDL-receptor class A domain-containing protein 1-like n=1 Tax=Branchiostoma belcheri TaxID=7741 RepID=A0A6P4XRC0_BRABE|nr:PREDICTED: MAM and LDL-receptor class A domain-containing protein 1-like [Branchiostoma belcheri]
MTALSLRSLCDLKLSGTRRKRQVIEHPLPCNFEDEKPCFWAQMHDDDFDWTRKSGPSGFRTGPRTDHTYGNETGHYMFIETSAPRRIDEIARIIGPVITPSASEECKMTLHFHMDGSTIGHLAVYKRGYWDNSESLLWTDFRDYGDVWKEQQIMLPGPQSFQVIIEGWRGTGDYGDIGIDDIIFSSGCFKEDSGRCDFETNFCNWTQSDQDNFDFQRGQGSTDTSYTGPQTDHTKDNARGIYCTST